MATTRNFRIMAVFAVLTTLLGIYSAQFWSASEHGCNFEMYYTAACLVRSGASAHIYDVIDPNINPQELFASSKSVFAQTAHAHGITRVSLYLYPPTLADLVVPFTVLSPSAALYMWYFVDILMIVGLSIVLAHRLNMMSPGVIFLVAAVILLFRPTLHTFHMGQVTILLAFLMTIGLSLYLSGQRNIAALLLVLAIAIKLEPIALVVPFIAWRDWKFLRSLVIWGILLSAGLWAVNGSHALNLYFMHQLLAMSGGNLGGVVYDVNRSLGNIFFTLLGGAQSVVSLRTLAWIVRVVSALILCYAGWLSRFKPGESITDGHKFEIGLIFLLLICCLSPYSWFYNWALSAPVVVMLFKRAWDGRANAVEAALLIALLLSLSTSRFDMAMITPILGVTIGFVVLYRMRLERRSAEVSCPASQPTTATAS